jgi:hypothetical protein
MLKSVEMLKLGACQSCAHLRIQRATVVAVVACLSLAGTARAAADSVDSWRLDNAPGQKAATLVPVATSTSSGQVSALTASSRYRVCGLTWAISRNKPAGIVLGSV